MTPVKRRAPRAPNKMLPRQSEPPQMKVGAFVLLGLLIVAIVGFDAPLVWRLAEAAAPYSSGWVVLAILAAIPPVSLVAVALASRTLRPAPRGRKAHLRVIRPSGASSDRFAASPDAGQWPTSVRK